MKQTVCQKFKLQNGPIELVLLGLPLSSIIRSSSNISVSAPASDLVPALTWPPYLSIQHTRYPYKITDKAENIKIDPQTYSVEALSIIVADLNSRNLGLFSKMHEARRCE